MAEISDGFRRHRGQGRKMLSIGKFEAGQHACYLDKVAEGVEDYYSGEAEAEGYWLGDAAEDLGLEGKVDADQLVAMLTGRNPVTGEPRGLLGYLERQACWTRRGEGRPQL